MKSFPTRVFCLLAFLSPLRAEDVPEQKGWDPDTVFLPLSPSESIKTIEVPAGYRLQCVASEPMIEDPVAFAFDPDGAVYVCEWRTYMQDEYGKDQLNPVSRVVKLVDTDGDGVMDKRTVFIDNAVLPRSVLPMGDRVIVNFTSDKTYWAYFDDDKDGVADRRVAAYEDLKDTGNIEHQRSGLLWNLDNVIATNDLRFRLGDDGKFTAIKHPQGRLSQWGLARDDDGRLFGSLAGGANAACYFQLPAGYPILAVKDHAEGFDTPYSICKVWDQSSGEYDFKNQRILEKFSSCCGQTVFRSHLMPEFYGNLVTCEPVGRLLRMSRIEWKDGIGVVHNAFPEKEFIRSSDPYFRPVWSETGPDGAFYFADMYRGIVQEKAWFPTDEKDSRKAWYERYLRVKKWGMEKVVRHGRIYRLVPESKPVGPKPSMLQETPAQLVAYLSHDNGWWRDAAQMLLVSMRHVEVAPKLIELATTSDKPNARIHAMWTLDGLKKLPKELLLANLKHPEPRVRRAAVQLLEGSLIAKDPQTESALVGLADDPDPRVVAQVYLAFRSASLPIPSSIISPTPKRPLISVLMKKDAELAKQLERLGESAKRGKEIYQTLCTSCHGPDAEGIKVDGKPLAPSLARSKWFSSPQYAGTLGRVVLHGLSGPIDGVSYGEGVMPALGEAYNDEQIASVLNYVGERWHAWKVLVTPELISRVRAGNAKRKTPWTIEELKAQIK